MKRLPGISGSFEQALRFARWVQMLGRDPEPAEISKTFLVCRATAYRWRAAWLAAVALGGR